MSDRVSAAMARVVARIYALDPMAYGPGNELVVTAVRSDCERILHEEMLREEEPA